jgi:hypothetical protein
VLPSAWVLLALYKQYGIVFPKLLSAKIYFYKIFASFSPSAHPKQKYQKEENENHHYPPTTSFVVCVCVRALLVEIKVSFPSCPHKIYLFIRYTQAHMCENEIFSLCSLSFDRY